MTMEIGSNIRRIRLAAGLTQQDLANGCGLTKGMISKVENGVVVPALGTLTRIAAVLQVKVATLMEADGGNGTVMTINPFADPSRFVMTVLGYSIFSPAAGKMDKRMQPIMICARKGELKPHLVSHQGDEFLFIFEGEMNFKVGEETYLLRQGDSLYFDALQKHGIASVPNEVKYLDLFVGHQYTAPTEPGEAATN
jgi:transcriptional regulator with XRE-family HTH domain